MNQPIIPLKVVYPNEIRLCLSNKTFREAVDFVLNNEAFKNYSPLKMIFTSTGKILFLDANAFQSFLSGNLTMQELVELTECDEVYRNTTQVISHQQLAVESGNLWKANRGEVILVNDDQYITADLDFKIFEIAK